MALDKDLIARAQKNGESSMVLLHEMTGTARRDAVEALAGALVRVRAHELADYLAGEPMREAREAAAGPEADLEAAKKALAEEQQSIAARLAGYFGRKAGGAAAPGEREPERDTQEVQALKTALYAAEQAARPFTNKVRILEEQIKGLRADAPVPDPAVLTVLAAALKGGTCDPD